MLCSQKNFTSLADMSQNNDHFQAEGSLEALLSSPSLSSQALPFHPAARAAHNPCQFPITHQRFILGTPNSLDLIAMVKVENFPFVISPFQCNSLIDAYVWSVSVVLKPERASEPSGGLVQTQAAGRTPRVSDSLGLRWGSRLYIAIKSPGDSDASGPENHTLGTPSLYECNLKLAQIIPEVSRIQMNSGPQGKGTTEQRMVTLLSWRWA